MTGKTATRRTRVSWLARLMRPPVFDTLSRRILSSIGPGQRSTFVARSQVPRLFVGRATNLGNGGPEEEAEDPVRSDPHPALRAFEPHEVGHAPENGGEHPRKPDAHNLVDGEVAPELHELPERFVLELLEVGLSVDGLDHVSGRHVAFLNGGLGGGRNDLALFLAYVLDGGAVSYGPDVALSINPERQVYLDSCPLVEGQPEVLYGLVRAVARRPDHVLRVYLPAALELYAVLRYLLGHRLHHHLDPLVGEPGAGGASEGGIQFQQDVRQRFEEVDPDAVRVDVGVVRREVFVHERMDLGGDLDARGSSTYDHEGELGVWHLVAYERDFLEALYDTIAYALSVLDPPHGHAVFGDPGDAEEVGHTAQGYDELVVRELDATVGLDHLAFGVHARYLGPPEARTGDDEGAPQGLRDVARVDVAADDPGHHRPEGKEIVAGQNQYPDVVTVPDQFTQIGRRRVTAEAPTEYENLLLEFVVGRLLPRQIPG